MFFKIGSNWYVVHPFALVQCLMRGGFRYFWFLPLLAEMIQFDFNTLYNLGSNHQLVCLCARIDHVHRRDADMEAFVPGI